MKKSGIVHSFEGTRFLGYEVETYTRNAGDGSPDAQARVCGAWAHGEIHVMYQWLSIRVLCPHLHLHAHVKLISWRHLKQ